MTTPSPGRKTKTMIAKGKPPADPPKPSQPIPVSVITELNDPDYEGMSHYTENTYHKGCRGPMCRKFMTHKSRYFRRVRQIAVCLETDRPYVSRKRNDDHPEMSRIILAMVLASKRKVLPQLASVCLRDGVPIPEWAEMTSPMEDIIPEEVLKRWTDEVNERSRQRMLALHEAGMPPGLHKNRFDMNQMTEILTEDITEEMVAAEKEKRERAADPLADLPDFEWGTEEEEDLEF